MRILTSNLIPYIGDEMTALVQATVVESRWVPQPDGFEQGTISVRVMASFGRVRMKPEESVQIGGGLRYADEVVRDKDNRNLWNALPFRKGDLLLFALQRTDARAGWAAMAAWPVAGVSDPAIGGLKRSIEAQNAPESKRIEYLPALIGASDGISRNYAMANLRNRAVATRQQAAAILAKAFVNASANVRLQMAGEMCGRSYLVPEEGAEPGNLAVLSALLQALVTDPSAESRKNWVGYLAAAIGSNLAKDPAKDAELRAQIVRAIADPPRAKAGAALRAEAAANPGDARIEKLAKAWGY